MSRPIVAAFAAVLVAQASLLPAARGFDVSKSKNDQLQLTDRDVVPKTQLKALAADDRGPGFIGDLMIGQRYPDETVFRRIVEYNNPTNAVQSTTLTLNVNNGQIHYISAQNDPGSYAVVCDAPYTLGSSKSSINLRVPPNSKSTLVLIIAAH